MIEGKSFAQQAYQTSMVERMPPVNHKKLEDFIRHNTIMFIEKVVVRKLSLTGTGIVWSFLIPERIEDLACHMFDLSLSCNVIDYQCGTNLYNYKSMSSFLSDVITVVESKNGNTNITSELIDMMNRRYAREQVNAN